MIRTRFFLLSASALILTLAPGSARAEVTTALCIEANTRAQDLRRDGKLAAAREQLRACANSSCPAMVRDDCTERLDELERAQPTIAFEVKSSAGADLIHVRISVDGQPIVDQVDGKPVNVDPGAHVFTFDAPGRTPSTLKLVLTEGQKGRLERVTMLAESSPPSSLAAPAAPEPSHESSASPAKESVTSATEPASTGLPTQKILGLVVGGVGVAGVAVGAAFGLMTLSASNQQKSDCASDATPCNHPKAVTDHSTMIRDGTISDVAFAAGGALLVGGAVLFFVGGNGSSREPSSGLALVPSVGSHLGGISLHGEF